MAEAKEDKRAAHLLTLVVSETIKFSNEFIAGRCSFCRNPVCDRHLPHYVKRLKIVQHIMKCEKAIEIMQKHVDNNYTL